MQYRRNFIAGGCFFFTVVTANRRPILATQESVEVLRNAFRAVRARHPFALDAIVVLPDHLHCIWTLPSGDSDFATRWRLIKTWFTKHCADALRAAPNRARANKHEQALWQRRYWEHTLRDEEDFARHADYIHFNPVKHGYASSVAEWPYSSFRRFVEAGIYPVDWAAEAIDLSQVGHE